MLAHIRAWLRRHGWAAALIIVLALAAIWAVLWPLTDALARHDVTGYAAASRASHLQSAREAVRTQLLTLGAGVFAAGALFYTARNFTLSRQQLEQSRQQFTDQLELSRQQFTDQLAQSRQAAQDSAEAERRTLELTEQGQVTDRYTRAIEQLGSGMLDVRIGGIYALERIARDSARDQPTVIEVLSAFIREHSLEQWPPSEPDGEAPQRRTRPDVQAALTVIGRRDPECDVRKCDLRGAVLVRADVALARLAHADLTGATLTGAALNHADLTHACLADAVLSGARLNRVRLTGATLNHADLTGAVLDGAQLTGAVLTDADLTGADLTGADLTKASLVNANLSRARLKNSNLTRANLSRASLVDARLPGAHFKDSNLSRARLAGADLTGADLTGADLTGALWSADRSGPPGWTLEEGSARLRRAGSPAVRGDTSDVPAPVEQDTT